LFAASSCLRSPAYSKLSSTAAPFIITSSLLELYLPDPLGISGRENDTPNVAGPFSSLWPGIRSTRFKLCRRPIGFAKGWAPIPDTRRRCSSDHILFSKVMTTRSTLSLDTTETHTPEHGYSLIHDLYSRAGRDPLPTFLGGNNPFMTSPAPPGGAHQINLLNVVSSDRQLARDWKEPSSSVVFGPPATLPESTNTLCSSFTASSAQ
jgi:hypothetical protein